ncbi:hypothetical protein CFC21_085454 [Triticum aestivum]|uniref:Rx N-terminal domain-containing protein n=2 Tax=Triticum aestivum TaxID=4565 RepID=A0A9R1L8G1_WHEAT|nr:disease resistance protein PIK6-NP-like [Triticum aestivum]KAF7081520.1 hypothetical protein CFC21_085454 [Triticum aestivum]
MDAQGAVDSLLGRLTAILINEAQLLGGLHSDVEFIKDEMESMNGLLLHLIEAHHRDHQVRAWMKQVVDLTRDCEGNVELYIHSVTDGGHHASGFLGYLRHIVHYVLTIPERHRIATRIRELKIRARDVSDRRLRYGVTIPPAADQADPIFLGDIPRGLADREEDARRCSLLINYPDEVAYVEKIVDDIIKSLLAEEELVQDPANRESHPRIFLIILPWYDFRDIDIITEKLYKRKMSSFSCKALVHKCLSEVQVLREILYQVAPLLAEQDMLRVEVEKSTETSPSVDVEDETMQLTKKLEGYLKGKRFLIILQGINDNYHWDRISSGVLHATAHGSPGSAVVIARDSDDLVIESPYKMIKPRGLFGAFCNDTRELCSGTSAYGIKGILDLCDRDVFAMKIFQHLMYVNPARGATQIDNFLATLKFCKLSDKSVAMQMVKFSYNDLPAKYRSCLLYLIIFPEGGLIRRTTVCGRWIAEGLITSRENGAEDEADSCFNALLSRSLIQPGVIGDMGKTKTCTLHHVVRQVITRIARDINFADTELPPDLARHLSIHSRIEVQATDGVGIVAILPYLAKSSQWQLLKMLDLEGCRGLKKQHLKTIFKIVLLKYLSLRNTDITELPKQIEKLQCLETLDIRQTTLRAFATNSIMLPMLKHLHAGQAQSPSNNSDKSRDLLTAVRIPSSIRRMEQLETLSHVEASHSVNDLSDVGYLLQLRKLGVILHGKKGGLGLLFQQIEKLQCCLRSLSIQINQPVSKTEDAPCAEEVVTLASPPKLLQSLNISGITSGLLTWIAELDQLTKITLTETYLGEDYIRILGKLAALCCLRLRRNSYVRSGLTFKEGEFKSIKSLVVDDGIITNITFDTGAAPRLEKIVWSFAKMDAICGLCLPKLKNVELNGDCDPDPVRLALEKHPNLPDFKHKTHHGQQEGGVVVAASPP